MQIGDRILIRAVVHKIYVTGSASQDFDAFCKKRGRLPVEKQGFVVGMRKKLTRWRVHGGRPNMVSPISTGYIVDFKERLSGRAQEAFLEDVELI